MPRFELPYSSCCWQRLDLVLVSQKPAPVALEMYFQVTLRDVALSKRRGGVSFVLTAETPLLPPRITVALCAPHQNLGTSPTQQRVWALSLLSASSLNPPPTSLADLPRKLLEGGVARFNYTAQITSLIPSNIKHFFLTLTRANLATSVSCI